MDLDNLDFYIKHDIEQERRSQEYKIRMSETYKPEVAEAYKELLARVDNGDKSVNENTFQDFLEHHTSMIPTPFMLNHQLHLESFISKLPIGPYVSDLAYLTKSSDVWNLVLIELESPHRKLFKGDIRKPEFSADYYHALQQIKDWKAEIEHNKERFLEQLKYLRTPLEYNDVFFKYVIVMGRNVEKSEEGSRLIAHECESYKTDLSIITYDRLLTDYERNRRSLYEDIVLTIKKKNNLILKVLPEGKITTALFTYVRRDHLKLKDEQIEILRKQGYEIDSWLDGHLLAYNQKHTVKGYAEMLPQKSLMREVIERCDIEKPAID